MTAPISNPWNNPAKTKELIDGLRDKKDKMVALKPIPVAQEVIKKTSSYDTEEPDQMEMLKTYTDVEDITEDVDDKEMKRVTHTLKQKRLSPTQEFDQILQEVRYDVNQGTYE